MNRTIPAALLAVTLTGCAGTTTPELTPTPTPARAVAYDDAAALRDAAVQAGLDCPRWDSLNVITNAASSGHCSDYAVLSTYLTEDAVQSTVIGMKRLGGDGSLLVGPNWIISERPEVVQSLKESMGGTVVAWSED